MTLTLLNEHHLGFLNLKGGCTGSSASIHVKIPHCWKTHVAAQLSGDCFRLKYTYLIQYGR